MSRGRVLALAGVEIWHGDVDDGHTLIVEQGKGFSSQRVAIQPSDIGALIGFLLDNRVTVAAPDAATSSRLDELSERIAALENSVGCVGCKALFDELAGQHHKLVENQRSHVAGLAEMQTRLDGVARIVDKMRTALRSVAGGGT